MDILTLTHSCQVTQNILCVSAKEVEETWDGETCFETWGHTTCANELPFLLVYDTPPQRWILNKTKQKI